MTTKLPTISALKISIQVTFLSVLILSGVSCKKSSPDCYYPPPTQAVAEEDFIDNYGANNFCLTKDNGFAFTGLLGTRESYVGNYNSAFGFQWKDLDPGYNNVGGICATSDNGLLVAANLTDVPPNPYLRLLSLHKFNRDGSVAWKKTFQINIGDKQPFTVRETPDKGFIVSITMTGSNNYFYPALLKISASGDSLWSAIISNDWNTFICDLRVTSDSGFIAAGTYFLVKTDLLGVPLWNKSVSGVKSPRILENPDGSFILLGERYLGKYFNTNMQDIVLVKTDANGNKLWEKEYDYNTFDTPGNICLTPDGDFIFTVGGDTCRAVKTDELGNVLGQTTLPGVAPLGLVRTSNHWVFLCSQLSGNGLSWDYLLYAFAL
jgi:hypothetical protein